MIVANLFFIKRTNGIFYYSIDYLKESKKIISKVLIRPQLIKQLDLLLPGVTIVECTFFRFISEILIATIKGEFIFTPSSHPLPFINKQLVVVHDYFPFLGAVGWVKKILFKLSLTTSKCMVGFINKTDVKNYLKSIGIAEDRLIFTPNKFPSVELRDCSVNNLSINPLYVGLIGTDSIKKNYEELFASHLKADLKTEIKYFIYGHKTQYYDQLIHQFPSLKIELIESESFDLNDFFSMIGPIVSVAANEGFGRPIASALLAGRPCYLLDQPVFREFYDSAAIFCRSIPALFENLISIEIKDLKLSRPYDPPQSVLVAFNGANKFLEIRGK